MKTAICMTLYNRPEGMLRATIGGLAQQNMTRLTEDPEDGTVVIFVDDGSTHEGLMGHQKAIEDFREYGDFLFFQVDTKHDRPQTYQISDGTTGGGYNNGAYAMNRAIAKAKDLGVDVIVTMSSDCIIPPGTIEEAVGYASEGVLFQTAVHDERTQKPFLSSRRIWPMGWFMAAPASAVHEAGGIDEGFLLGQAFEDNDYVARMFLLVGALHISDRFTAIHQDHEPVAYSDHNRGFNRNQAYICEKWNSRYAPFNVNGDPLAWKQKRADGGIDLYDPMPMTEKAAKLVHASV